MAATVWGTFCSHANVYGLSFYCKGSHCSSFQQLSLVSCQTQPKRLYCTNAINCADATYTNDFYIVYDGSSQQANVYDTITANSTIFNQTVTMSVPSNTSSAATKRATRNLRLSDDSTLAAQSLANQAAAIAKQTGSLFKRAFSTPENPATNLYNGVADAIYALDKSGFTESPAQIFEQLTSTFLLASHSSLTGIAVDLLKCQYEDAIKDAIVDVTGQFVNELAASFSIETFGASLVFIPIAHVAIGAAVSEIFSIGNDLIGHKSGGGCSASSTSSMTSTSSSTTSSASSISITSPSSTSSVSKTTTSTSPTSSPTGDAELVINGSFEGCTAGTDSQGVSYICLQGMWQAIGDTLQPTIANTSLPYDGPDVIQIPSQATSLSGTSIDGGSVSQYIPSRLPKGETLRLSFVYRVTAFSVHGPPSDRKDNECELHVCLYNQQRSSAGGSVYGTASPIISIPIAGQQTYWTYVTNETAIAGALPPGPQDQYVSIYAGCAISHEVVDGRVISMTVEVDAVSLIRVD